jgi:phosphohistidine swiveling domain-containing protein
MTPLLIDARNHRQFPEAEVGGKGRNLLHMAAQGLPVPPFVCLTAAAYEQAVAPVAEVLAALLARLWSVDFPGLAELSVQLQRLVDQCQIPSELMAQLRAALPEAEAWSVRSSGLSEDGRRDSFAGQFLTRLNVSTADLASAIKACWASGFEAGVLAYVKKKGLRNYGNRMAVVIQAMVSAERAGVMFQMDPNGDESRQVVVAGFGLGEGVVADRVETDTYIFCRRRQRWDLHIAAKTCGLVSDPQGGTRTVALTEELGRQPVLSEAQRAQLLALSEKIFAIYREFQDIEWAFDSAGKLFVLQSRPITAVAVGQERIFDNSNIAESYPGVISPMTFSVLQQDYYHCMKDLLRLCGVARPLREKYEDVLQHLVGYINGRAYYNMGNWYGVVLLAPFFKKRLVNYFEQMIGSEGCLLPGIDSVPVSRWETWQLRLRFPLAFLWNLLRHGALQRRYFQLADRLRLQTEALACDRLSADELIGHLHHHVRQFMPLMSIPLLNDFFAMIFMALTREQFVRKSGDHTQDDQFLLNRLLGNQNIASARPVESLAALADVVRKQPDLKNTLADLLVQNSQVDISQELMRRGCGDFAQQWQKHLQEYGQRSPRELVMEVDTFQENPRQLLQLLLQSVEQPAAYMRVNEHENLEADFRQHLKQVKYPRLLRWLLHKTRQTIAYREATRLDRGRHFGLLRQLLRHIGRKLAEEGILREPQQVFYLTLSELDALRQGTAPDTDWIARAEARQAQALQWRAVAMPSQVRLRGLAGVSQVVETSPATQVHGDRLTGSGVAGGQVQANARVVRDPQSAGDIAGRILVAETTDPGWVFLMTLAAGLICERGSLLSHTAIIGRELGIPTVVGVKGATRYIRDGALVTMNGHSGEIRIHATEANAVEG